MMTLPKGILAMDESSPTIAKRLESINTENNEINRRRYRELIVTTPELSSYISGAILFEETFDQKMSDGTLFRDYLNSIGILPGIKVDKGILNQKKKIALAPTGNTWFAVPCMLESDQKTIQTCELQHGEQQVFKTYIWQLDAARDPRSSFSCSFL